MQHSKRVLITGATGLVGNAIKIPDAVRVGSADYDLTIQGCVRDMFREHSPTHVIHCAAKTGGVGAHAEKPANYFEDNILINTMVLREARLNAVERFVGFSSSCVFPDDAEYPLTADRVHLGAPHYSNAPYAYAKRMAMIQTETYRRQFGIEYTTVIPCNIYGPHDRYDLDRCHVIPALIRKCYEAVANDDWFTVWGSGKPMREFIYSDDVGELAKRILFGYTGEPLMLSTSEEASISDIAHMIASILGYRKKIKFDSSKPDGQFRKPSDNSPIKKLYPDFTFTPIEEGLEQAISWFVEDGVNGSH